MQKNVTNNIKDVDELAASVKSPPDMPHKVYRCCNGKIRLCKKNTLEADDEHCEGCTCRCRDMKGSFYGEFMQWYSLSWSNFLRAFILSLVLGFAYYYATPSNISKYFTCPVQEKNFYTLWSERIYNLIPKLM